MVDLAIIADDLTGALDAAAPFAVRGLGTVVALGADDLTAALETGAQILGVSTDSREIAPDAARVRVATCIGRLPKGTPIFKKIDSRLKGNIAAELDAIPFKRGLAIPAIPAFGRWSRSGMLGGAGVAEPINIAQRLGPHASSTIVPDAATQSDIESALASVGPDLPIGARSLAEALAVQMAPHAGPQPALVLAAPAICIIGSTDPITLAQVERLQHALPDLDYRGAPDGVLSDETPLNAPLTVIQSLPGGSNADPLAVAQGLAQALCRLAPPPGATLVISGGATAQVVLGALGVFVLHLFGEALPGLPIARAGGFTVITKSGGFGGPQALVDLLGHLAGITRESHV
jgi:uncharacterized protein YgbK (DUF1537 family)